jgi:hypothetical protein
MKFPVNSLLAGNSGFRDEFARDCLLQRGVCELLVPERRTYPIWAWWPGSPPTQHARDAYHKKPLAFLARN